MSTAIDGRPRRRLAFTLCAALCAAGVLGLRDSPAQVELERRPNVLWIITDQHRADVAGYEGNTFASTPSLDRLATESVRVSDFYCQAPLCVPARQSLLTGQLSHSHGAFRNTSGFPDEERTLAHAFSEAGYATALVGKAHCNTAGFEHVREFKTQLAGFMERHPDGRRPGVEHYRFRRTGEHEYEETMNPGNLPAGDGPRFFMEVAVVEDTLEYLAARDPERPFFVWASFLNPHPPLYAPDAFRALFVDAQLPLLGSLQDAGAELSAVSAQRRSYQGLGEITDAQLLEITRAYHAALAWSDHCVGLLLDGLDELGLAEDTLVIYTSDHGELLGEHGLLQKRSFYEGASRVPCLLRWPGHLAAGAVRHNVAQHVDLTATVLDLAGVTPPNPPAGRSMRALLEGADAEWEDLAFAELLGPGESGELGWMMRAGRFKYVWSGAGGDVLFDLQADPGECENLAALPEHAELIDELWARFDSLASETSWKIRRPRR